MGVLDTVRGTTPARQHDAWVLDAAGVHKTFPARRPGAAPVHALRGASLRIRHGAVHALVGESGSGKSTFGRAILRLLEVDAGRILFDGTDLRTLDPTALRRMRSRVQWIPQQASTALNPGLSVAEHLSETIRLHRPEDLGREAEVIDEVLRLFRLEGRGSTRPAALSGGERRRVVVARALLPRPELVIADEPTAALDAAFKAEVLDEMVGPRRGRTAWLFISHELDVVRAIAEDTSVMFGGVVVETLPARDLHRDGDLQHPYTRSLLAQDSASAAATVRPAAASMQGCPFLTRCPLARASDPLSQRCATAVPPLVPIGPSRSVACHAIAPEP